VCCSVLQCVAVCCSVSEGTYIVGLVVQTQNREIFMSDFQFRGSHDSVPPYLESHDSVPPYLESHDSVPPYLVSALDLHLHFTW